MEKVTIVGGGMAGLTAALRLQQRGFEVTLYEQDNFLGGKWGAHADEDGHSHGSKKQKKDPEKKVYHEHCYHMLLNWFNNFWRIVDELGLRDRFEPSSTLKYLRTGEFPHTTEFRDVGSPATALQNLFSGVLPVPDSFIYSYSLIDLVSQQFRRGHFLDQYSVNGFMHSRPYSTDAAAIHHQRTLAKAFASPSYLTSASTYKSFIKYGLRHPEPMMWILKGNCQEHFHEHLERRLTKPPKDSGLHPVEIHRLHQLRRIHVYEKRAVRLTFGHMEHSPTLDTFAQPTGETIVDVDGYLIVTIPPHALANLVDEALFTAAPELGNLRKLTSEPMASIDLYFNKKLPDIPKGHVVLWKSKYDLTFIDNSQYWPDEPHTVLNIVASDFDVLDFDDVHVYDEKKAEEITEKLAYHYILQELKRFLPFNEATDVDWEKTHVQTNIGETLFVNQVGSWEFRPTTETSIGNLFLAGDYCRSVIDVVTIEAATVTGLMAAEAIRSRERVGEPIEIIEPDCYPELLMGAMKLMWAPYAYAAKFWSWAGSQGVSPFQGWPPRGGD